MNRRVVLTAVAVSALLSAAAAAQTADQVVEKNLAAMGGRAALEKLQSRTVTGALAVAVQGNDLPGTIAIWMKAPNKSRSLMRLDLRAVGGGELVIDQRCDGQAGFVSHSARGDRELTGDELQHQLNAQFPTPLLHYKEMGARVELGGTEKVNGRDAVVLVYTPRSGSPSRLSFDPDTWLLVRAVTRLKVEGGAEVEQVSTPSDYRVVGGVKVPFVVALETPGQVLTMRLDKVEHNLPIDDALFRKPAK